MKKCSKCQQTKDFSEFNKNKSTANGELHCHHISSKAQNVIEECDLDNGITYCKECHKQVHTIPGCTYNELKCG